MQRASSSIGSNIAEGSARSSAKDFRHFLYNALGSAKEIEYQLLLAKDLDYISRRTYDELMQVMDSIIGPMINYMKRIIV